MFYIDKAKCTACKTCISVCANDAITIIGFHACINNNLCIECGACYAVCPVGAITQDNKVPQIARYSVNNTGNQKRKGVIKMPFMDRTGPWGEGPMTGRGMGYCAGYVRPGYPPTSRGWFGRGRGLGLGRGLRRGRGGGIGRGFGLGRGRGWFHPVAYWDMYPPQMTQDEEANYLKDEASAMKAQLEEIEARIKDLESEEV